MTIKGTVILKRKHGLDVYIVLINGTQVSSHMSEAHAITRLHTELNKRTRG